MKTAARDHDRAFFTRELDSFLPDRIYDAHCHVWRPEFIPWGVFGDEEVAGWEEYSAYMTDIHGDRPTCAMFIPFVTADRIDQQLAANEWAAKQVHKHPLNRGNFFIKPDDDPEWVREHVQRLGLHGLKCYHTMSKTSPTWEADIQSFLPETLIRVADEEGWFITLHMVKSRAVADPANISCIRHYCETYPNMNLILAHSARGFQPCHNLEGLPKLTGLDNLWFDTSANCEPMAHQAIIRIIGHDKLMYGSDFMVSHHRGRSLGTGDSFIWLYENTPVWGEKHLKLDPILVGLEHLRSLKWACWSEKLSDTQVEDIFWNNAARLFKLES